MGFRLPESSPGVHFIQITDENELFEWQNNIENSSNVESVKTRGVFCRKTTRSGRSLSRIGAMILKILKLYSNGNC